MYLDIDKDNKIINFATVGAIEGAVKVELSEDVQSDFISKFAPKKFIFENGEIVEDKNYKELTQNDSVQVSATQQVLGAMMKQIADLSEAQKQSSSNNKTQVELGAVSKQVAMLTKQNLQLQQALGTLTLQLAKEDK